jgi:NADH-quinone oxidoreductase subunit N
VPIAAFMAAAVKAAAFAAFLRVWSRGFSDLGLTQQWHTPVLVARVLTMVVGNVVALAQRASAPARLLERRARGLRARRGGGRAPGRVGPRTRGHRVERLPLLPPRLHARDHGRVRRGGGARARGRPHNDQIDDYAGLWHVRPGLAIAMSVFMLALLGFPLFGGMGFVAKYYMLQAALRGGARRRRSSRSGW